MLKLPSVNLLSYWNNLSFRQRGSLIIGIPITCLIITLIAFSWIKDTAIDAQEYVEHTQQVRYEANQLLMQLLNAETGIRGYAITRKLQFLEPYQQVIFEIPQTLYNIENLVEDNERQLAQARVIQEVARENINFFREKLYQIESQTEESVETPEIRQLVRGKHLMDEARAEIAVFVREEERLLKQRQLASKEREDFIETAIFIEASVGILSGFLALYLFFKLNDELKNRELRLLESAKLSKKQARELSTTLDKLKQTQSSLIHSEKMSSLGQMVAGIAHEINNPISFIHGNLFHLKESQDELLESLKELLSQKNLPATVRDRLEEVDLEFIEEDSNKLFTSMQNGSERIRDIIKSLRSFSRLDEADKKAVNIHQGIEDSLLILGHKLSDIEIEKNYGDLPKIECFASEINQVFLNVLSNAVDAIQEAEEPGTITITTHYSDTNESKPDGITIDIKDTGVGIDEAIKDKIFNPFFTTKAVGAGTGLGLAISYQILHRHQGEITIDSVSGEGTHVHIFIPLTTAKLTTAS
ncbi:CHASE3 domain-containing protein [Baaleninema sp.]|uniref:CHASE3 domain-containing protein n=1 Tax=Baaleninema sp. TaxID=3101197 RepID=UPI003D091F1F